MADYCNRRGIRAWSVVGDDTFEWMKWACATGRGAAIGVIGAGVREKVKQQQAQQQRQAAQQQAQQQQQAARAQQQAAFQRGFAACMEARGYVVK